MKKIIKKILASIIREVMSDTINEVKELKSMQKTLRDAIGQIRIKRYEKQAKRIQEETLNKYNNLVSNTETK